MVAADVAERRVEGVGDERQVVGLQVAGADDQVDRTNPLAGDRRVERRVGLVGHGEDPDRPAAARHERRRVGPRTREPIRHRCRPACRLSRSRREYSSTGVCALGTVRDRRPSRRLPNLVPHRSASSHRAVAWPGWRDAGQQQLGDVRVDLEPPAFGAPPPPGCGRRRRSSRRRPARGRSAAASRADPIARDDALPSAPPVLAAQLRQRQEVGRVLRWVAHGADDPVERDAAQADRAARRGRGARISVKQRREHVARGSAAACRPRGRRRRHGVAHAPDEAPRGRGRSGGRPPIATKRRRRVA